MASRHTRAGAIADRIQVELVRLDRWAAAPIDPARLVDMGAFGRNTLAAEEWIQFVLLPRIREVVATHGEFPATSETATWAAREFDGDPDAGTLVGLLRELDAVIEDPPAAGELHAAIASANREAVAQLLDDGAQVNARGLHGLTALHVAAAGGHALLPVLLANPFEVDVEMVLRGDRDHAAVTELLLDRGAAKDAQADGGLTPLMVAEYFGHREVAAVLRARGADEHLRDSWGRTAERISVFQTAARVIAVCRRVPAIASAYLVQVHAPVTHQYTTPALGLELAGPLPPDAFAGWPADQPIVVFVVGAEDALSRLVRLAPPVFPRRAASGLALASAIATGVAGTVRELPSDGDKYPAFGVVLPDGRMPVLVRDFGHSFTISLGGRSWHPSPGEPDTDVIREAIAAIGSWSASPPGTLTLVELASEVAATLSAALGDRWTISIPGTPAPTEMQISGKGVSVGVFDDRLVFGNEHIPVGSRDELVAVRPRVIAAVRTKIEQHDRYEAQLRRGHALATDLAERLTARLGGTSTIVSYSSTHSIRWKLDDNELEIVEVTVGSDAIRAHAGLAGADGWKGTLDPIDDDKVSAIVAAIELERRTLTIYKLVTDQRYRVLQAIGDLEKGAIVRFSGFDDIDNHYGRYVFVDSGGNEVAVHGDFSTPKTSPLGETHRYLEPLPD
jgi:uncharacterized protein YqcC (DUF446 family)